MTWLKESLGMPRVTLYCGWLVYFYTMLYMFHGVSPIWLIKLNSFPTLWEFSILWLYDAYISLIVIIYLVLWSHSMYVKFSQRIKGTVMQVFGALSLSNLFSVVCLPHTSSLNITNLQVLCVQFSMVLNLSLWYFPLCQGPLINSIQNVRAFMKSSSVLFCFSLKVYRFLPSTLPWIK